MASMAESQIAPMAEATLAHLHKSCGILFSRKDFPNDFFFGSGSSAYQIEGAANEGGRGKSIWDTFTHSHPEKIVGGANGDVAVDGYHRYKEDVQIAKDIGLDVYRFSISWSRVLPKGRKIKGLPNDGVNEEGIKYYSDLIDELKSNGIKPFVTLFHWDVPQALDDEYHGFLSPLIVDDFVEYAKLCFERFGDRVKHWTTLNEPHTFCSFGYMKGIHAPGRCSPSSANNFEAVGNSAKEPYLVAHHMLLAHAAAFNLYKASQDGQIGITLNTHWFIPYYEEELHKAATQRALDFTFGWFMDPLFFGEYPQSMRAVMDERLKNVIDVTQVKRVKGTLDFLGVNYYTSRYCKHLLLNPNDAPSYATDSQSSPTGEKDGVPIGDKGDSTWLYTYPKGLEALLLHIKDKYNNPVIYITENGCDDLNKDDNCANFPESIQDTRRVKYYKEHLDSLKSAMKKGVDVRGFIAWSLTDNFEWAYGYSYRFGIYYVDYKNNLNRHPKLSAFWFKACLEKFKK